MFAIIMSEIFLIDFNAEKIGFVLFELRHSCGVDFLNKILLSEMFWLFQN